MSRADPPDGFDTAWQIQAFALTQVLLDRQIIDAESWTRALSAQLHAPDAAQDGADYYARWVAALQQIVTDGNIASADEIARLARAWAEAAAATPHGTPITPPAI